VQVALTNVIKHAGPARAPVVVRYAGDSLELEVADDGRGASKSSDHGHGLRGCASASRSTGKTSTQEA
jgi:signal transduction histidine kinase